MPPKPKKTKEEKLAEKKAKEVERLRLEAEERKRIEEENERLRLEALALQLFRNEQRLIELNGLEKEFELFQINQITKRNISYEKDEEVDNAKQTWETFRAAKEQSIADNEKEMNGFLTFLREIENQKLPDTFKLIKEIFSTSIDVYGTLTECIARVIPDSKTDADTFIAQRKRKLKLYATYLTEMYDIIIQKLDKSLFKLLRYAERYVNDKNEIMLQNAELGVNVGLYCCFSEFYRRNKTVEFDRLGITLDIPKEVLGKCPIDENDDALQDLDLDDAKKDKLCFRVIQMKIDKYSHLKSDCEEDIIVPTMLPTDDSVSTESADLPKTIATATESTAVTNDLYAIGDFYHIDIFPSPPLAKFDRLMKVTVRDLTQSSDTSSIENSSHVIEKYPLKFKMNLPAQLLVSEFNVTMGTWDEKASQWCVGKASKGLSNIVYNRDEHSISFEVSVMNVVVALVRSTSVDLPYKSWLLSPAAVAKNEGVNDKSCLFELQTANDHKLHFSFHKNMCKLINPSDDAYGIDANDYLTSMRDLFNKEMRPSLLLHILKRRGLNLIANNNDILFHNIQPKERSLEEHVTLSISRCAVGCEISSSRYWNDSLVNTQVGIIIKESQPSTNTAHDDGYEHSTTVDPNKVHYILCEVDSLSTTNIQAPTVGVMSGTGIKYTLVVGLVKSSPEGILTTDDDDLKKATMVTTIVTGTSDSAATDAASAEDTTDAEVEDTTNIFISVYSNAALENQVSHVDGTMALLNVVSENTSGLLQNYTHERLSRTICKCLRLIRPYSLCQTPVPKPPAPVAEELTLAVVDSDVNEIVSNEAEDGEVAKDDDPNATTADSQYPTSDPAVEEENQDLTGNSALHEAAAAAVDEANELVELEEAPTN